MTCLAGRRTALALAKIASSLMSDFRKGEDCLA
ncbi:MAG: hypothetical protein ACJAZ8_001875 [Planctomycetota bacterium]|jgi:hypothetical protein